MLENANQQTDMLVRLSADLGIRGIVVGVAATPSSIS